MNDINTDQYGVEARARYQGIKLYFEVVYGLTGKQLRKAVKNELTPRKLWN
jgi:hypothetical protein